MGVVLTGFQHPVYYIATNITDSFEVAVEKEIYIKEDNSVYYSIYLTCT